jgi:hypothetical protein
MTPQILKCQLAMAGAKLKGYFAAKAKERQGARTDIVESFPQGEAGKARDQAAEKVGAAQEKRRLEQIARECGASRSMAKELASMYFNSLRDKP